MRERLDGGKGIARIPYGVAGQNSEHTPKIAIRPTSGGNFDSSFTSLPKLSRVGILVDIYLSDARGRYFKSVALNSIDDNFWTAATQGRRVEEDRRDSQWVAVLLRKVLKPLSIQFNEVNVFASRGGGERISGYSHLFLLFSDFQAKADRMRIGRAHSNRGVGLFQTLSLCRKNVVPIGYVCKCKLA